MGSRSTEIDDRSTVDSTPEDVAALYSWANLQGAKYRDYSASRREYRAQVRYRAAKALLERELAGQLEAEASAGKAELAASQAQITAHLENGDDTYASRIASLRNTEDAVRRAHSERVEAVRRAEAAARASVLALCEEREIVEAHSSSLRQAVVYEESELLRRQLAGPQPYGRLTGSYAPSSGQNDLTGDGPKNLEEALYRGVQTSKGNLNSTSSVAVAPPHVELVRETIKSAFDVTTGKKSSLRGEDELSTPAWLNTSQPTAPPHALRSIPQAFRGDAGGGDTLQDSRERVAARWFALKGVFDHAGPELPPRQPLRPANGKTPLLAAFSFAGGVGKTSLIAALGRALASNGERVVLADTTSQGLLGIYFDSREPRPSAAKMIPSSAETTDSPVSLVVHDFEGREQDDRQRDALTEEVLRSGEGKHRLLLDLPTGSSWLIRRLVNLHPTVLVPIAPDMNSVIGLQAAERLFRELVDSEGRTLLPFYVLSQFDASLPLHLDVREVFRRQLGDRLLRFAIRRSQSVSEALADGMTVLDYAPEAPVSQDYRDIALWLRGVSPPATEETRHTRWGER